MGSFIVMLLPHPAAHSTVSYQQAPELQTLPDSGNLFLSPLQSEDIILNFLIFFHTV